LIGRRKVIKNIAPDAEITYDNCLLNSGSKDGKTLCNCGAAKCRETMYSKEEIKRRKAVKRM
jgi:hypothetical protein